MNTKINITARYIYIACALIALLILAFVVSSNANEDNNLDVNEKYTIKREKTQVKDVNLFYPQVQDMEDKKVEDKINKALDNLKESISLMISTNTLMTIDYKAAYKGNDYLSFVFKGTMRGNENEYMKSLTLNVKTGDIVNLIDLIDNDTMQKDRFKELIAYKITSNGIDSDYTITKESNFYLEKAIKDYQYVFYFLPSLDGNGYYEVRVTKNELENVNKVTQEENKSMKDEDNNKPVVNNTETKTNQILKITSENELLGNKIFINGEEMTLPSEINLYISNSRVFAPLEFIAKKLGYKIEVNEDATIKVFNDLEYSTVNVGEDNYYNSSISYKLGEKTMTKNDIVFVPVEFFATILNKEVYLENGIIHINQRG